MPYGDPNQATIGTIANTTPQDWLTYYQNIQGSGLQSGSNPASNVWNAYLNANPWVQNYFGLETDPKQGYGTYVALNGGNNQNYESWLSNQYNKYWDQYNTLQTQDPTQKWTDYLKTINPGQDYAMTDPYSRGGYFHQSGQYSPVMRMIQ